MAAPAVTHQAFHRTVASYMGPFRMRWSDGDRTGPTVRLVHGNLASSAVMLIDYPVGGDVERRPLRDYFAFHVVKRGRIRARLPDGEVKIGPGQGFVVDPALPVDLTFSGPCSFVLLRLDVRLVREAGARQDALIAKLRATGNRVRLDVGAGRSFQRYIEYLANDVADGRLSARSLAERRWTEKLLAANFVAALSGAALSVAGVRATSPAAVAAVERAEAFMRRHIGEAPPMARIAQAADVSVRALNAYFRGVHHMAPSVYFRQMRLEAARARLVEPAPAARSITEIASGLGFSHFGRFAGFYQRAFGETPRETRRRARCRV